MSAEFDRFAAEYDELLKDPVREYFAPGSTFFMTRKLELLLETLARLGLDPRRASWLDVGCGQGQLLRAGRSHFARAAGCDVSAGMMQGIDEVEVVAQTEPDRVPFDDNSADLVTAVCMYHHVDQRSWARLTADIRRVLRPGGVFAIVEHNPLNPIVQLIVRRTPVDEHATLFTAARARRVMRDAKLDVLSTRYFLYVPERLYRWGRLVEKALEVVPMGGQYAVFGRKP
jgi:SAM-dependent methyltransferase